MLSVVGSRLISVTLLAPWANFSVPARSSSFWGSAPIPAPAIALVAAAIVTADSGLICVRMDWAFAIATGVAAIAIISWIVAIIRVIDLSPGSCSGVEF